MFRFFFHWRQSLDRRSSEKAPAMKRLALLGGSNGYSMGYGSLGTLYDMV
jgi:hypothetical protein